ncbi:MAG TPA: hypothetical protein VFY99_06930 [Solirubrobacterales bacterium]
MERIRNIAIVCALLAALAGGLTTASASADRKRPPGKKAQHIKSQLQKRLEARGLENVDIRRCLIAERKVRGKTAVNCTWYAEGILPGPQPYRCHGDSLHGKLSNGKVGFIRIAACQNKAPVQIPVSPTPVHEPEFGYNDEWHSTAASFFDSFDRLAPDFARSGLEWQAVEHRRGTYDWGVYDRLYQNLISRGIAPLWTVSTAPCFAQENPSDCRNKARPATEFYDEMGDFAAAAVKRYPLIGALEVFNEPNAGKYWGGQPEPDLYADMFKTVEEAVEKADPGVPVLFGSLSPHAESDATTVSAAEFLAQGYDLGAVQQSDGISTHPYPGTGPGEDVVQPFSKRLGDLWEVMLLERDTERPLWITEVGVSTFGDRAFSPEEQAQALVQIYDTVRRIAQVKTLIFHRFRDAQGDNEYEPGYGSVDKDGTAKPAYCAIGATRGLTVC